MMEFFVDASAPGVRVEVQHAPNGDSPYLDGTGVQIVAVDGPWVNSVGDQIIDVDKWNVPDAPNIGLFPRWLSIVAAGRGLRVSTVVTDEATFYGLSSDGHDVSGFVEEFVAWCSGDMWMLGVADKVSVVTTWPDGRTKSEDGWVAREEMVLLYGSEHVEETARGLLMEEKRG